jgi:hypothetical protein
MQVDALKLEPFVDSFIGALGLNRAYTMLVLNPKWSASLPAYGYRIGFSEYELRLLNDNVSCFCKYLKCVQRAMLLLVMMSFASRLCIVQLRSCIQQQLLQRAGWLIQCWC